MEGDLVAHCGDTIEGGFLHTLVLTDIASTWTEFLPLLRKGESDVIKALQIIKNALPFSLLGLDTDNGSEFINYALLNFCKKHKITFTRSRAYKKNDQAHVEEKNGSIIRRLIGYDRYKGLEAYNALYKLYKVLRLYINFFQPSLKLASKMRDGAKVTKKYYKAKTPYQRLVDSDHITAIIKEKLRKQYEKLDPVMLLKDLEKLQDNFWQHAVQANQATHSIESANSIDKVNHKKLKILKTKKIKKLHINSSNTEQETSSESHVRYYKNTKKAEKKKLAPQLRIKTSIIDKEWDMISSRLEQNPELTAKGLLRILVEENPEQFSMTLKRTMQRRVAEWRSNQLNGASKKLAVYPRAAIQNLLERALQSTIPKPYCINLKTLNTSIATIEDASENDAQTYIDQFITIKCE